MLLFIPHLYPAYPVVEAVVVGWKGALVGGLCCVCFLLCCAIGQRKGGELRKTY